MRDLENNISTYIENDLINHIHADDVPVKIDSPEELRRELNGDNFLFIC